MWKNTAAKQKLCMENTVAIYIVFFFLNQKAKFLTNLI